MSLIFAKSGLWAFAVVIIVISIGCTSKPPVQTLANIPIAAAGVATTCIVDPTRALACYGQSVGDGASTFSAHTTPYVNTVLGKVITAALGIGTNAGCAIKGDGSGSVACWGYQLISGSYSLPKKVVSVPGVVGATEISVGRFGACAIVAAGAVTCWKFNDAADDPVGIGPVAGLPAAKSISVGYWHACIVDMSNAIYCWGKNPDGQVGNGVQGNGVTDVAPTLVPGVSALSVAAGVRFTCGLLANRTVSCWGYNGQGELGFTPSPGGSYSLSPKSIPNLTNVAAISAGDSYVCAVRSDRTVWCWGDNKYGTLGIGSTPLSSAIPLQVTGITTALFVSAADTHACVSGLGLLVKCWGKNTMGELTDGTTTDSSVPVP